MTTEIISLAALWWAVIVSGVYHGINPGMGWPLAISAALMQTGNKAFPKALGMLAFGHFVAMIVIFLPFSVMLFLVEWEIQIRIVAGLLVVSLGIYLIIDPRHPKFLVRVHPSRIALWSFLSATAHGAGLMLLPIYLGICSRVADDAGHFAMQTLLSKNLVISFVVAGAHTASMTFAGGLLAFIVFRWLGLKFLSRTWFNLDRVWALSLIIVGIFGTLSAVANH